MVNSILPTKSDFCLQFIYMFKKIVCYTTKFEFIYFLSNCIHFCSVNMIKYVFSSMVNEQLPSLLKNNIFKKLFEKIYYMEASEPK